MCHHWQRVVLKRTAVQGFATGSAALCVQRRPGRQQHRCSAGGFQHGGREVRLAYQPLLQRYRVSVGGLQQNYDSLDEALGVVQRTRHLRVAEAAQLVAGQTYQLDARFRLDLSQLPRPFQLNVSSQSDWKIEAVLPPQPFVWTP